MIYLYGIALPAGDELRAALAPLPGVTGPVDLMPIAGGAALIAGSHDGEELPPARRHMLAHARVLEAAMATSTVLPMSFGSVADDTEALLGLLRSESDGILKRAEALAGMHEFGIRVSFPKPEALAALLAETPALTAERDRLAAEGPNAHYAMADLGRRVGEALVARRDAAALRLGSLLEPFARDMVIKLPEEDIEVFRAEVLLPAGTGDAFAETAFRFACDLGFAGAGEPSVRIVGPAPPFHFADLALGEGRDAA